MPSISLFPVLRLRSDPNDVRAVLHGKWLRHTTTSSSSNARVLACISVPTPVEEDHRDCSVVTATMAMGITAASAIAGSAGAARLSSLSRSQIRVPCHLFHHRQWHHSRVDSRPNRICWQRPRRNKWILQRVRSSCRQVIRS